jgi:hypothetical protein
MAKSASAMAHENLRDMVVDTSHGKDVKDTDMLKGEASNSLSGTNETKQYTTGKTSMGKLGGLNTND